MPLPIALVTDEAARDLRAALALVHAWGLARVELREGGTARFPAFTPDEWAALDHARADGIAVTAVSPGIFKGDVRDAARLARDLDDTLPRTLDAAVRLGCPVVISFGFERVPGTPDDDRGRVVEALARAAERVHAAGMRLAVENEPGFWVDRPEASAALVQAVGHPALGLNWDPANLDWGGHRPTVADAEAVRSHLLGLHVKDFYPADPAAPWRALGEGVTPWPALLRWAVAASGLSHVTLETHTLPLEDASRRSLATLRRWLAEAEAAVNDAPSTAGGGMTTEAPRPNDARGPGSVVARSDDSARPTSASGRPDSGFGAALASGRARPSSADLAPGLASVRPADRATVRLALVGLGGHGRTLQDAAASVPGVEVVAVFDPNVEEAARAGERFGLAPSASYEALLETPGLDGVVLVTPNRLHRAQAEAAFARGLHVLAEKPLAHTLPDAAAMLRAADAAGRLLAVGHNQRYSAPAQHARTLLAGGALGSLVSVEIHFASDTGLRLPPDSWRLRPDECPLLPVTQLGLHGLDLVHALVGPIVEASAVARAVAAPPGVVDSVVATFRTASGVLGTLQSHYCTPVRFAWTLTGTDARLHGTPHTLDLDRPGHALDRLVDVRKTPSESYAALVAAFAEAIRSGQPAEADGAAGFRAQAVVDAMDASARAGSTPVAVEDVPAPSLAA